MFLIQQLDNDPRLLGSLCRLPRVIDIVWNFYWESERYRSAKGSKPLLQPARTIAERPSRDEIHKIRLLLLSLGEMSLRHVIHYKFHFFQSSIKYMIWKTFETISLCSQFYSDFSSVFQAEHHIRGCKSFDSIFWDMSGCSMHRRCSAYGYPCNFSNISPCFFSWTSQSYWWMPHFRQSSSEVSFFLSYRFSYMSWLVSTCDFNFQIYMNLENMGGSAVFCKAVVVFMLPNF